MEAVYSGELRATTIHSSLYGRLRLSAVLLGVLLAAACEREIPADLMIHNVRIIDVRTGSVATDQAIVVDDGLISELVGSERSSTLAADIVIDGGGAYIIPALADAHVHLQSRYEFPNYVHHGVGLVVNMSGNPLHLALREDVNAGRLVGPEILTVGPTLDGIEPTNPLFVSVTADDASPVVAWIAEQGYDAVKVYQQMDAEALKAVIAGAESEGLITTGHVSRETGVRGAIDAGQRFFAHGEELAFEAFDEEARRYDVGAVTGLAELLAHASAVVTPMIGYLENIGPQVTDLDGYLDTDWMRTVPAAMRMSFDARQGWFANRDDPLSFKEQIASLVEFVRALTVRLHEEDVLLLLGTDAGFGGAVPGYSVHQELEALVRAGLTELAAIQSATVNIGEYLHMIDADRRPWGEVKPGFAASLLLIGGNPLDDIRSTRDIRGVVINGRWFDSDSLDALEVQLRDRQSTLLPLAHRFEQALVDGNVDEAVSILEAIPPELADEPLITADNCIFLGYRHYYGGDRTKAGRLYEVCARMHRESSPLWVHIARAAERAGETDRAKKAYWRARDLNPWYGDPGAAIERLMREAPP